MIYELPVPSLLIGNRILQAPAFCNGEQELKKHNLPAKDSKGSSFAHGLAKAILPIALRVNTYLFQTDWCRNSAQKTK